MGHIIKGMHEYLLPISGNHVRVDYKCRLPNTYNVTHRFFIVTCANTDSHHCVSSPARLPQTLSCITQFIRRTRTHSNRNFQLSRTHTVQSIQPRFMLGHPSPFCHAPCACYASYAAFLQLIIVLRNVISHAETTFGAHTSIHQHNSARPSSPNHLYLNRSTPNRVTILY